jgi:2-hydroxy-3-keto-5-methylthiopentenyl-1-phosphate phosphatase
LNGRLLVTLDFDGTIVAEDITDAVIEAFAGAGWEKHEALWQEGLIGSRECLAKQMALIDSPLESVLEYIDRFAIDRTFTEFLTLLKRFQIPFAVVSDGFGIFAERLLSKAGLKGLPVYANQLKEERGRLSAIFPHASGGCSSGLCKCKVTEKISGGHPIIHIGDGLSDFCLSRKAAYVFAKGKLADLCKKDGIPYSDFRDFVDVKDIFGALLRPTNGRRYEDGDYRFQENEHEIGRID